MAPHLVANGGLKRPANQRRERHNEHDPDAVGEAVLALERSSVRAAHCVADRPEHLFPLELGGQHAERDQHEHAERHHCHRAGLCSEKAAQQVARVILQGPRRCSQGAAAAAVRARRVRAWSSLQESPVISAQSAWNTMVSSQ
jgi:hypothetical protein